MLLKITTTTLAAVMSFLVVYSIIYPHLRRELAFSGEIGPDAHEYKCEMRFKDGPRFRDDEIWFFAVDFGNKATTLFPGQSPLSWENRRNIYGGEIEKRYVVKFARSECEAGAECPDNVLKVSDDTAWILSGEYEGWSIRGFCLAAP